MNISKNLLNCETPVRQSQGLTMCWGDVKMNYTGEGLEVDLMAKGCTATYPQILHLCCINLACVSVPQTVVSLCSSLRCAT